LLYVLGRKPHEFALVPDREGFVTYKELIQALNEEPGWRYVRQSHIHEVLLGKNRELFQPEEKRIRATDTHWELDFGKPSSTLPAILYMAVRRKAHPVVMEKGLRSAEGRYLILSPARDMAFRIGKRRDQEPVVLEILARAAGSEGVNFYAFGDLFLGIEIPARFIAGPPISKEVLEERRPEASQKEAVPKKRPYETPGTFLLDLARDPDLYRRAKGRKRKGWKEEARGQRKRRHS
jgi:putative RNA 2'-phosphotransferase